MKIIFFLNCFCLIPYQIIIIKQLMISFGNLRPFKEKEFLLRFCLSRFSETTEMTRLSGQTNQSTVCGMLIENMNLLRMENSLWHEVPLKINLFGVDAEKSLWCVLREGLFTWSAKFSPSPIIASISFLLQSVDTLSAHQAEWVTDPFLYRSSVLKYKAILVPISVTG